jgi:hypothetical protein
MLASIQAVITEWALVVAALACLAAAGAAVVYVPVFGRYVAACLVALACGLAAYDFGYRARGALDNSGAIQAQLDEANRELAASKMITAAASAREQAATAAVTQQQGKIDDYEKQLASRGNSVGCALTSDDLKALNSIGAKPKGISKGKPAR